MTKRELTCIGCPLGCPVTVTLSDDNTIENVEGYTCLNGKRYAESEVTSPTRVLTTSVRVSGGRDAMCSVKSSSPIPKSLIVDAAREVKAISIEAPVAIGDVIVQNLLGSGVNLVATREVRKA